MTSLLPFIIGPLAGIVVGRLLGAVRTIAILCSALLGQLVTGMLYAVWQRHVEERTLTHPASGDIVAFLRFQPSVQQRLGAWMIQAGIALGIAAIVLLLLPGNDDARHQERPAR